MSKNDIKEIIKKGNKARLIQLAVEIPDFNAEGLKNPTLTKAEKEEIWDKAKKGGWDGELFRATYKAKDIEAMVLAFKGYAYEGLYYLQELHKELQRLEILLDILRNKHIGDFNEKTNKYESIVNKEEGELEKDIKEVKCLTQNTLGTDTYLETMAKQINKVFGEGEEWKKEERLDKGVISKGLFNIYKNYIQQVKMGLYLIENSQFGGYSLYKKDQYKGIKEVYFGKNMALVIDVVLSLDHLDYLVEIIKENSPALFKKIKKEESEKEGLYIPDKEMIREIRDFLSEDILLTKGELKEGGNLTEEYLLKSLDKESLELARESSNKLKEYVLYDK